MTVYRDQSFATRFAALGDAAESVFEAVWPTTWERYGLRRPNVSVAKLPQRVRHTPDYLTTDCFVEVKGAGRDQTLKLKLAEWNCAHFWNAIHPLHYFVWDSSKKRWATFPLTELERWVEDDPSNLELERFHDGKAYFAIPLSFLQVGWESYRAKSQAA